MESASKYHKASRCLDCRRQAFVEPKGSHPHHNPKHPSQWFSGDESEEDETIQFLEEDEDD